MQLHRVRRILVAERGGDVLAAEKDLTISGDGANGAEHVVGKCLNLVSHGGVPSRDPVEKKSCRSTQGVKGLTPLPTNPKVLNHGYSIASRSGTIGVEAPVERYLLEPSAGILAGA